MPVWFRREKSQQALSQDRKQENGCRVAEEQRPKPRRLLMCVDEDTSKKQQPRRESRISTSTTTLIFHGSSGGGQREGVRRFAIRLPRPTSIPHGRHARSGNARRDP